jgi:hypothetical protein
MHAYSNCLQLRDREALAYIPCWGMGSPWIRKQVRICHKAQLWTCNKAT